MVFITSQCCQADCDHLKPCGCLQDENLQSAPETRVGTAAYLAPEVIVNANGNKYDAKVCQAWGPFLI